MACRLCLLTLLASLLNGCFSADKGTQPPLDSVYFPVGLSLGAEADRLYVANSNFDLAYNQGTLMTLDASEIRKHLPQPCSQDSDCDSGQCDTEGNAKRGPSFLCIQGGSVCPDTDELSLVDGLGIASLCAPLSLSQRILKKTVRIAPFVTDMKYVRFLNDDGEPRARLLLPVRGDATLHWADVETAPGQGPVLDCGQGRGVDCDGNHRRGDTASEGDTPLPDVTMPTEPFAITVTGDGRAALVAHQAQGKISLFANTDDGPVLRYVLDDLPYGLRGIARVPVSRWAQLAVSDYQPGFLTTFRHPSGFPTIVLVRYYDEAAAGDVGPFLQQAGSVRITVPSNGLDSRGIAVDDAARLQCEAQCKPVENCDDPSTDACQCLAQCATIPLSIYVANRSPASLLMGSTDPTVERTFRDDLAHLSDMEPLRTGPSRVYVNNIIDRDGSPAQRVFVLAFDSGLLYIYDPELRSIEARIHTGAGPQALAVDEQHALAYVAHFTDSNLGVVDLDRRNRTYGTYLLTLGEIVPLETSK